MLEKLKNIFGGVQEKGVKSPLISVYQGSFLNKLFGSQNNYLDYFNGWVYRCVNLIAGEVGATPLKLYEVRRDGEYEEKNEHELLTLLDSPNETMTGTELLEGISASLDIDGNAYVYKVVTAGRVAELWLLRPDWIKIVPSKDKTKPIEKYVYYNGKDGIPFELSEIIHIKELNPKYFDKKNPFKGIGKVEASLEIIEEDRVIKDWNKKFIQNGATLGGVLEFDGNLKQEEVKRILDKWNSQHGGEENVNKTAFLQGGLKYKPTGVSQREMAFIEQRKLDRDDILAMFGVPKGLLISEDVNLANSKTALWSFTRFTVKPRLKKIEKALNERLIKDHYMGANILFEFDDPVPEDREAKLAEFEKACNKWRTVNEIRAEEGLEPLEGYDELKAPTPITIGAGNEEEEEQEEEQEEEKGLKKKDFSERDEIGEKAWEEMLKAQRPYEDKYKEELKRYFGELKLRVLQRMKGMKKVNTKATPVNRDEEVEVLVDLLTPLQREFFEKEVRRALRELGLDSDFEYGTDVESALKKNVVKLAGGVSKTTVEDIKTVLKNNQELGADKLSEKIEEYFVYADKTRADAIARSETIRVSNMASEDVWVQSEVVEGKEWYTSKDERLCEFCRSMDGKKVGLRKSYFKEGESMQVGDNVLKFDYSDIDTPPLHTNCRCVLLPIIK